MLAGWGAARHGADLTIRSEALLSRGQVPELAFAVEAAPDEGLAPLLLWIPGWARIHQPMRHARPRLAVPVASIAAYNARRRSLSRTVTLLSRVSGQEVPFRLACMLATLHGMRTSLRSAPEWTPRVVSALCRRLGFQDVYSIWHYAGQETLPLIGQFSLASDAMPYDFGVACAELMSRIYVECFPARIFPVRDRRIAGPTFKDLRACLSRVSPSLNDPYGNPDWRRLDRASLERLVWTKPRTDLRRRFGVSDTAIAKLQGVGHSTAAARLLAEGGRRQASRRGPCREWREAAGEHRPGLDPGTSLSGGRPAEQDRARLAG